MYKRIDDKFEFCEFIEGLHLTLFNAAGQILLQQKVNNNAQVDVGDIDSGTYFIVIHDPEQQVNYRQKIVIVK